MSHITDDHFTALIYQIWQLMHNSPPAHILPLLQWVFKDIKAGIIAQQGFGNGEGSCGIAAYNFIELAAQTRKGLKPLGNARPWTGSYSSCTLHHLAHEVGGTFSDWTVCISDQILSTGSAIATGYNDFNMYTPLVHH
ncbi:hypothetical protein CPB84DRAFT_1815885 [Gymnopilus junonius]|uniref:Uncharacterized protein n=1 Tax=Gymnopilus junonius TaxID=109634 RepID=A0A9P5NMM2_GYMJU|nr:hypothetical protein CPB84DRAFT_1815885 [Gymnopilus junonius]